MFKTRWGVTMNSYEKVVKLLQSAEIPCAIVGGAVRARLHDLTLEAKDYDIIVHAGYSAELLRAISDAGGITCQVHQQYPAAIANHFQQHYQELHEVMFEGLDLDVLVLREDKYNPHVGEGQYNRARDHIIDSHFRYVVSSFDNVINQCYHPVFEGWGFPTYLNPFAINEPIAKQCSQVTEEREAHIKEIASRMGWVYVPADE